MSKQPEALRLAGLIEHYNSGVHSQAIVEDYSKAADELRRLHALTEPEPEPVAWKHDCAALLQNDVELWIDRCPHCGKPRTTPPAAQRKPLTDNTLWEMWVESPSDVMRFARAIERAHGIGDD